MGRASKARNSAPSLDAIKTSYRNAREIGDKEEEAKWANQIGHAFKDRGEYVTALKWFRKDYEISTINKSASESFKLMPTCQSIGEVYLRLQNYDEALTYQHKHFHLAEQAGDIVEQQRASTQLGRTYIELYESTDRLSALTDAKAYFQTSLDLARRLRTNPPADHASPSSFVVEQVDAYNNLGLARSLAEDYKQAFKFYSVGLKLCDEEEVDANDAARSRIHHNLGRLYAELRDFDKAKSHTEKDIEICQKIPHAQGEAKGLMNLADLHFKSREYEQASRCYKRALHIAQTLEDEDSLCFQIKSNLEVVDQAKAKSKLFDANMQKLSKLRRDVESSKGTKSERSCIKQECALLMELTAGAEELQAWDVHLGLAKRMKKRTTELGDHERLGDALEIVASSYYNLRNFEKAIKWHRKSFELCKRIGHLEGQIVGKINYGNALDASGRAEAALKAYQEAFEEANSSDSAKMMAQRISALNNIHYSYFVRLENLEAARKIELQLKQLKHAIDTPKALDDDEDDRCSETGSEGPSEDSRMADECIYVTGSAPRKRVCNKQSQKSKVIVSDSDEENDDNSPVSSSGFKACSTSPLWERSNNTSVRLKQQKLKKSQPRPATEELHAAEILCGRGKLRSGDQKRNQPRDRRKRVISDDEMSDTSLEIEVGRRLASKPASEPIVVEDSDSDILLSDMVDIGAKKKIRSSAKHDAHQYVDLNSDEDSPPAPSRKKLRPASPSHSYEDLPQGPTRMKPSSPFARPSSSANLLRSQLHDLDDVPGTLGNDFTSAAAVHLPFQTVAGSPKTTRPLPVKIPPVEACTPGTNITKGNDTDRLESGVSETYLAPAGRRARPLPAGDSCQLDDLIETQTHSNELQVVEDMPNEIQANNSDKSGSTQLMECYMAHCMAATMYISPNSLLVERLCSQKVSEEVVVSGCNINDNDARPLLAALGEIEGFSLLDLSHNLLGNASVHAIQELIKSTNQTDLGLTLDLHCNKLGAGALLQLYRCPVFLSRLEVLNLSSNRLTDAVARQLSKILKESQALVTLNLESCALTTRSISTLAAALNPESSLTKLCIGKNNPTTGFAIQELVDKLSRLTSFAELDLKGLDLDQGAIIGVCTLLEKSTSLSTLILQGTNIHNDDTLALADALDKSSQRLAKLDLSLNRFNMEPAATFCSRLMPIRSLSNLNLSGNNIGQKAAEVIAQCLAQSNCRLKTLDLSKCKLGQSSVLRILQSLKEQTYLLDLNLAENIVGLRTKLSPTDRRSDNSASSDCRMAEGSEGQSESSSKKPFCKKMTPGQHLEGNCRIIEGPGAEGAEATADSPEETRTKEGPEHDLDGIQLLVCDGKQLVVCLGQSQAEAAAKQTLRAEICEERVLEAAPDSTGRDGLPAVQADQPEVDSGGPKTDSISAPATKPAGANADGLATDSDPMDVASAHGYREELATSIRVATGLQQLDLSRNELEMDDISVLYQAWSAYPRGNSGHQQHVDGSTVHYFVAERPCPCSDPPCCASH